MATRTVAQIQADLDSTRATIEKFKGYTVASSSVSARQVVRPAAEMLGMWMQREATLCTEMTEAEQLAAGIPSGITIKYGVPI